MAQDFTQFYGNYSKDRSAAVDKELQDTFMGRCDSINLSALGVTKTTFVTSCIHEQWMDKIMHKFNKITKVLGATFVLTAALQTAVEAAETISNAGASVTVTNSFNFTETTALSFGSVRAVNDTDSNNAAVMYVTPAGSTGTADVNSPNGVIQTLGGAAPAVFSVDGLAPFAAMTITVPAAETNITADSGAPSAAAFLIPGGLLGTAFASTTDFSSNTANGWVVELSDGTQYVNAGDLVADGTGAATFTVGAALKTVAHATNSYIDDAYSGTYAITVDYD